jgi:hypothetical protein
MMSLDAVRPDGRRQVVIERVRNTGAVQPSTDRRTQTPLVLLGDLVDRRFALWSAAGAPMLGGNPMMSSTHDDRSRTLLVGVHPPMWGCRGLHPGPADASSRLPQLPAQLRRGCSRTNRESRQGHAENHTSDVANRGDIPVGSRETDMQFNKSELSPHTRALYAAGRKVADIVWDLSPRVSDRSWAQDRRNERVNPSFSQTASGLFLAYYYGHPGSLWTPWGLWTFVGDGGGSWSEEEDAAIMRRLKMTVHQDKRTTDTGEFGPVYALRAVDGQRLADPVPAPRPAYLEREQAREMWDRLTADWRHANGIAPPRRA